MDENTKERGGQVLPFATTSPRENSGGLNERSYAVPQQTGSNGDGAAQQCTSISDATNPLHPDSSGFNDQSDAVPQQNVPSSDSVAQQHHTSPSSSTTVTQLAHPGSPRKSFLDLPAEIRNMIYCCVFPEGKAAVQLLARHSRKGFIAMSDRLHLLYTCRQIYEEATSLLQAARRFKVVQPRSLLALIDDCWYPNDNDCHCCHDKENGILDKFIPEEGLFFDYDMDRGTVKKNIPALLHANKSFQLLCVRNAPHVRITAQTSTSTTGPISDSFGALQDWWRRSPFYLLSLRSDLTTETSVILNFKMSAITQLEDIRFEMNSLSDAIARHPPVRYWLAADLIVRIEDPDGPMYPWKKQIVDVLMDSLMFIKKVRTEHPELRDELCPKILIDGTFRVREAQFRLRDGNMLQLTNEESFWMFDHLAGWDDQTQARWDEMISAGLVDDVDLSDQVWPLSTFETINNETLEGSTVELTKRVMNCFNRFHIL